MNKSMLLGTALSVTLLGTPVMAEELYAVSQITSLAPMAEEQLAAVEGGGDICIGCANVAVVTQLNLNNIGAFNKSKKTTLVNAAYVSQSIN